jgi:hypothetical protein
MVLGDAKTAAASGSGTAETTHDTLIDAFYFKRDLDQVHRLLDHISGRPDRSRRRAAERDRQSGSESADDAIRIRIPGWLRGGTVLQLDRRDQSQGVSGRRGCAGLGCCDGSGTGPAGRRASPFDRLSVASACHCDPGRDPEGLGVLGIILCSVQPGEAVGTG